MYIWELPEYVQEAIKEDLEEAGIFGEELEHAMNSKLSDLEDTIDVGFWN